MYQPVHDKLLQNLEQLHHIASNLHEKKRPPSHFGQYDSCARHLWWCGTLTRSSGQRFFHVELHLSWADKHFEFTQSSIDQKWSKQLHRLTHDVWVFTTAAISCCTSIIPFLPQMPMAFVSDSRSCCPFFWKQSGCTWFHFKLMVLFNSTACFLYPHWSSSILLV